MKKTFFQKTFNLNVTLLVLGSLCFFLKFGLSLLIQLLETSRLAATYEVFYLISEKLSLLAHYIQLGALCLVLIPIFLIGIELIQRLTKDSLWNYVKSVYQTFACDNSSNKRNSLNPLSLLKIRPLPVSIPF